MKKFILLLIFSTITYASSAQKTVSYVCYECHGLKMDESCMGVSNPPNSFTQESLLTILKNYKNEKRDEYGVGSIMTRVLSDYTNKELKELSEYIPTLK